MTSTNDIKLANGALDPDRWGYGAGHLNPTPAANPGLVYDASATDQIRFLCGVGALTAAAIKGAHDGGVAVTIKHFPGHGDTTVDSHRGLSTVTRTREQACRHQPRLAVLRASAPIGHRRQ